MWRFRIVRRRVSLKGRRKHYEEHRERARATIVARARHFAALYGLRYKRIFIRNQKSRWGSCSREGNLNFHYKVGLLRPDIADYVIVHEICHLAEFNHSKSFWSLVARAVPNHKMLRKELREVHAILAES